MKLSIDMSQRYAKMRAHTATHLLHAELAKIFPDTKQAGSLVDEDLLRFDFYANNLLTQAQIQQTEKNVNQTIYEALPVDLIETSFEE
jgi:alanyl-tRNA synthetase